MMTTPTVNAEPRVATMDVPVAIRASGLHPSDRGILRLQLEAAGRGSWQSWASFDARSDGGIDVSSQAPVAGTYEGIEPMGLFWSMDRMDSGSKRGKQAGSEEDASDGPPTGARGIDPMRGSLTLEVDGQVLASCEIERRWLPEGVGRRPVTVEGLVGTLFLPPSEGPVPAILVLGGSEGGLDERIAALLSRQGFATLALAYFGCAQLPDELASVPLEYIEEALNWLSSQEEVDSERIAVWGGSKGAELALVMASRDQRIRAAVAYTPSSVVWQGISRKPGSARTPRASWSNGGEDLPFVKTVVTPWMIVRFILGSFGVPLSLLPLYAKGLENEDAVRTASIPVERINGPVHLVSGTADRLWPSSAMAQAIEARLAEHGSAHECIRLSYEGAGHAIVVPNLPTKPGLRSGPILLGGDAKTNAQAAADAWEKIAVFLRRHLVGNA